MRSCVSVYVVAGTALAVTAERSWAQPAWFDQSFASARIQAIAQSNDLPGMSAAIRRLDQPGVGTAVWGVRRVSTGEAITPADRFHVGSNGKAFTAQIAARAVESGEISWDTTVDQVFGGDSSIDPGYRGVTLRQLLSHQGGTPNLGSFDEWAPLYNLPGSASDQRLAFARGVLAQPRAIPAGTSPDERYSNAGYNIAAAMVERATGRSWESSVDQLFNQGMGLNVQIGGPGRNDGTSQPAGHLRRDGAVEEFGSTWALPSAVAPAGDLNMTPSDLAEFGLQHLRGLSGLDNTLGLTPATVFTLHDYAFDGYYGLGWYQFGDPSQGIYGFGHSGSTSIFNTLLFVDTINGFSIAVASNGYLGSLDTLDLTLISIDGVLALRAAAIPSPSAAMVLALGTGLLARRRRR